MSDTDPRPMFWEVTPAPSVMMSHEWLMELCQRVNAVEIILYRAVGGHEILYLRMPDGVEIKAPVKYWNLVGARVYWVNHAVTRGPH